MLKINFNPHYDEKEVSIPLNWLLPMVSDNGEFEIDRNQYPDGVWDDKKKQLHLLCCSKLIEYEDWTNDDHILGVLTTEGLKMKEKNKCLTNV